MKVFPFAVAAAAIGLHFDPVAEDDGEDDDALLGFQLPQMMLLMPSNGWNSSRLTYYLQVRLST